MTRVATKASSAKSSVPASAQAPAGTPTSVDETAEGWESAVQVALPAVIPIAAPQVTLVNLSLQRAAYVPLKSGLCRLAPKESVTVLVEELTADAHRVEAEGRINIRTL